MRVLVTGATGFVGNYVIKELLTRGIEVIATSLDSCADAKKFDWFNDVTYIEKDISLPLPKDMLSFFMKPDRVIHLAWSGLPNYSSMHHIEENLWFNYHFIKNMIDNGLEDITIVGTCAEYGLMEGKAYEEMSTRPVTPYAIAKDSLRRFLEVANVHNLTRIKWVRLFYIYGDGQRRSSILAQLDEAIEKNLMVFNMSGGEQIRDYIKAPVAAKNIVSIAVQNKVKGVINCCSGHPISIRTLVERYILEKNSNIQLHLGRYPYSNSEPLAFWGDTNKMRDAVDGVQ